MWKLTLSLLPVLRSVARQAHSTHIHPLPFSVPVAGVDSNHGSPSCNDLGMIGNGVNVRGVNDHGMIQGDVVDSTSVSSQPSVPDHLNSLARLRLLSSRRADKGYSATVDARASLVRARERLQEWMGAADVTIACLCGNSGQGGDGDVVGGGGRAHANVSSDANTNVNGALSPPSSVHVTSDPSSPPPPPPPPTAPIYASASPSVTRLRNRTDSAASMTSTGTLSPTPPCYDTRLVGG